MQMRTHLHLLIKLKKPPQTLKSLPEQLLLYPMPFSIEEPDLAARVVQFLSERLTH